MLFVALKTVNYHSICASIKLTENCEATMDEECGVWILSKWFIIDFNPLSSQTYQFFLQNQKKYDLLEYGYTIILVLMSALYILTSVAVYLFGVTLLDSSSLGGSADSHHS